MKQLIFVKTDTPQGTISVVMRFIGKLIYFRFNNNQYAQQVINTLREKGAFIKTGRMWVLVNMFTASSDVFTIQGKTINITESSPEQIEDFLADFYAMQYTKAGFKLE